jgi:Protein of unknown function (DUF1552)
MIVTRKAISRRTVLRGMGVTLALPLLDGMFPAFASAKQLTRAVRRLAVVYVPNGIVMQNWTPVEEGVDFTMTPTLAPLAAFKEQMTVVTGLNGNPGGGPHAGAATRFLTDVAAKQDNAHILAGVSVDQYVAQTFGQNTQLASLELGLDTRDFAGSCDIGYSCAYTNTISWKSPTTPLPIENDPRAVFERLFGDGGTTDPAARLARNRRDRSILDSVVEKTSSLSRQLGHGDRSKIDQYLEAIRDVERRIQKAEEDSAATLPSVEQPAGVPSLYSEHAKLMFDMQLLAYQSDLTRVITFMMGREISGRSYAEIGVPDAHHPISHHQNIPENIAKLCKINAFHTSLLAYYLEKLRATPDGEGTLLDSLLLIYGSGMSDSNAHSPANLPILLAGGTAGQLKGGRHVKVAGDVPLANLHLTLLDRLGIPLDAIGNSTGRLKTVSL